MTLSEIEADIYKRGSVNREHVLEFLKNQPTTNATHLEEAIEAWLKQISDNPKYSKVVFGDDQIEKVVDDLNSYGRVQPETILEAYDPNRT